MNRPQFQADFSPGTFHFAPKQMTCSESLWPLVLCSHCITVRRAKAHTAAGLSSRPYITASCVVISA